MRIHHFVSLWVAVALSSAAPLVGQAAADARDTWHLAGLSSAFCVQFLIDPASQAVGHLPAGYSLRSAQQTSDLHVSLRGVIEGQPEFGAWAPSSLCLYAVDTIQTAEFTLADKSGRRPYLLGVWLVNAADPTGLPTHVALDMFTTTDRLVRAARRSGVAMHDARLTLGKVPGEDEEGRPSTDDRFQVRRGKTTVTWDGRPAGEETPVQGELAANWVLAGSGAAATLGGLSLSPAGSRPMAGSLKVDGQDALAKALRGSPTRFAGPEYRGGEGTLWLKR